jgi:hypothetical protein
MKKSLLISLLICSNASAQWNNPNAPFSTRDNVHETMLISWKTVDNVQQVCQDEFKSRGHGAFNYKVDACAFMKGQEQMKLTVLPPSRRCMPIDPSTLVGECRF